jgi:uncharacterized membrane protein HdeD (DUF308 family)
LREAARLSPEENVTEGKNMEPSSTLVMFAANWRPLLFRGWIAVLTGVVALLWPGLQPGTLVAVFGAYALADGLATMTMALRARGVRGFGSLLTQGLVSLAAGIVAFTFAGMPTLLPTLMAGWGAAKGIAELVTATGLRREVSTEWPLTASAALSIIFGALIMPGIGLDVPALAWVFAFYAIFLGIFLVASARRLRQLADEMALP